MAAQPARQIDASRKFCSSCGAALDAAAQTCPSCGTAQGRKPGKSKVATALLAFFLGGFGAHRFYLGQWGRGLLYVLFCWTLIPGIVAFVEFIVFLAMSEEKFAAKYGGADGGGGGVVAVVIAIAFGGVFVVGILAAIAIPNFIRYQLRAKSVEGPTELRALADAEQALHRAGRPYVAVDALPAQGRPGSARLAWGADDVTLANGFGWAPGGATYGVYRVAVANDAEGHEAASMCAELDLDGDGHHAATVLFLPGTDGGAVVLPPPPAPCSAAVDVARDASLEFKEGTEPGTPLRVSPPDVF